MSKDTPVPEGAERRGANYEKLKRSFKVVNAFVLGIWRLHLGWCMNCCPPLTGRIMILTCTGRTSGLARRTPVNYRVIESDVWVAAMPGAAWLRNVQADPRVQVQRPFSRWRGVAEAVPVDAEHLAQFRAVLLSGGWIVGKLDRFDPRKASEDELLDHGRGFSLLRIHHLERIRRRTR